MTSAISIAITSGKGGVGKTSLAASLAVALALEGRRVCLFDADTGLANINIVLGLQPRHTLSELVEGTATLDQVLLRGPAGLAVLPAASGAADMLSLDAPRRARLMRVLRTLEQRHEVLLLDTAAGIGEQVLHFACAVPHVLLVITPEPTSLTDAFALLRVLARRGATAAVHVTVNMVRDRAQGERIFTRFRDAVQRFIGTRVGYFGVLPRSAAVADAVLERQPFVLRTPRDPAAQWVRLLARKVPALATDAARRDGLAGYWSWVLCEAGLDLPGQAATGVTSPELDEVAATGATSPELDEVAATGATSPELHEVAATGAASPGLDEVDATGTGVLMAQCRPFSTETADDVDGLRAAVRLAARLGEVEERAGVPPAVPASPAPATRGR